jgi:hypothetical protein
MSIHVTLFAAMARCKLVKLVAGYVLIVPLVCSAIANFCSLYEEDSTRLRWPEQHSGHRPAEQDLQ